MWVPFTQGAALGYVLLPLRGVLLVSFDTLAEGAFLARLVHLRQVHPLSVPPLASAVQSDSVRRPIRFRTPSDQIPYAVQSDSVRRPIGFRTGDDDFS